MPEIYADIEWSIALDTEELRLVLKGLGGRLKPEELTKAKELGNKLTLQRTETVRSIAEQLQKNDDAVYASNVSRHI